MRLFVAINFNDDTKKELLAFIDELRCRCKRGRFSTPDNLHLTLAFLGECNLVQTATVKTVMDNTAFNPFPISIERVGRFRRDGGDLWWAGVRESNLLVKLHGDLTNKLRAAGFTLDKRKFSPHITLGRGIIADVVPWTFAPFGETVKSIELMKSERINDRLTYTAIYRKAYAKTISRK